MADSLANMFDSPTPPRPTRPAQQPSSPTSPVVPSFRRNQPALFDTYSSGSESEHAGPSRKRKQVAQKANRNQAAADAARRAIAAIEDGSDLEDTPRDAQQTLDPMAGMSIPGTAADGDDGVVKKRRVMPKIDPDRLLGPNGLVALARQAKQFKVKGKGHEAKDLRNLMTVYQLWAHQMFPRGTFKDTVARVEKVCSARRMDVALSGIMDAERPASPPLDVDGIDDSGITSSRMDMESTARRLFEPAPSLSRSPSPASAPGRRPVEEDDDGGPSIEELMAMEEEQAGWEAMDAIGQGLDEPLSAQAQAQAAMAPEDDYDDLYD